MGPSGFGSLRPVGLHSVARRVSRFSGFRSLVRRFRGLVGVRSLACRGVRVSGLRVKPLKLSSIKGRKAL